MTAQGSTNPTPGAWRDGDELLAPRNALLVERCFRCGKPAVGGPLVTHLHVTNAYHRNAVSLSASSLLAILDLFAYGVFVIAFLADLPAAGRRRFQFGLCGAHRAQRYWVRWSAALAATAGPALWIGSLGFPVSEDAGVLMFLAGPILLWLAALLSGLTVGPQLVGENARVFRLSGAGKGFLAAYPTAS